MDKSLAMTKIFHLLLLLQPVRGRRVGRAEGVRRGLHAALLRLLPRRQTVRTLAPLRQPPQGPVKVRSKTSNC